MEYLPIEKTFGKKGTVKVRGWIHRIRKMKDKVFIVLRDSSNIIQCVLEKKAVSEEIWKDAKKIKIETSLEIEGTIKEDARAPTGFEVLIDDIKIIGLCENYPIQKDLSKELINNNEIFITDLMPKKSLYGQNIVFNRSKNKYSKNGKWISIKNL